MPKHLTPYGKTRTRYTYSKPKSTCTELKGKRNNKILDEIIVAIWGWLFTGVSFFAFNSFVFQNGSLTFIHSDRGNKKHIKDKYLKLFKIDMYLYVPI